MTPAAFSGNYADIKTVKTRGVFQVIVEMKIEDYQRFVSIFGGPLPGSERPVALALLKPQPKEERENKRHWGDLQRSVQAGILCSDPKFQLWLSARGVPGKDAADALRNYLNVKSRALLDEPEFRGPAMKFDALVAAFRQETGMAAEQRA